MRLGVVLLPLLFATPALAQTAQERAAEVMVNDMIEEGFAADVSALVAECFVSRMTVTEAEGFLAAENLPAQQEAVATMADSVQATLCVAEVLG